MKKILLLTYLLLTVFQISFSQKIKLNYKVLMSDSSVINAKNEAFSDKIIQNDWGRFFLNETGKTSSEIVRIEDMMNRRFEKVEIKQNSYLLKTLNKGYYKLYLKRKLDNQVSYVLISPMDTFLLEQVEVRKDNYLKMEKKYIGVLKYITQIDSSLSEKVNTLKFKTKDIQRFVSEMNDKQNLPETIYKENPYFHFLSFTMSGFVLPQHKYCTGAVQLLNYDVGLSPNISLRVGAIGSYYLYQTKSTYPYSKDIAQKFGVQTDFDMKISSSYVGIPLSSYYEMTNKKLTPYASLSIMPLFFNLYVADAYHEYDIANWKLFLNLSFNCGGKWKITPNINTFAGLSYEGFALIHQRKDISSYIKPQVGFEYVIPLNKKLK